MSNIFLSKQRMSNVKHCLHVYLKYYNRNRIAISLRMQPIYGMKKDEKIITSHVASSLHDRIRKSSKQICFYHEIKKENYNIQDIWNNCLNVAKYFKWPYYIDSSSGHLVVSSLVSGRLRSWERPSSLDSVISSWGHLWSLHHHRHHHHHHHLISEVLIIVVQTRGQWVEEFLWNKPLDHYD